MDDRTLYARGIDLLFLLLFGLLCWIARFLWIKIDTVLKEANNKAWCDKFEDEIKTFIIRMEALEKEVKDLTADRNIREAIAKAIEDLKYKNGL